MRAAVTDPLTGVGNRRRFDERLKRGAADKRSSPVSVCLLDVDDLKNINDRHGHPVGNLVLAAVGTRLASSGEAFRLGGDEFALLLPAVEPEQARLLVELVLVDLALEVGLDEPIKVSGESRPIPVTTRRRRPRRSRRRGALPGQTARARQRLRALRRRTGTARPRRRFADRSRHAAAGRDEPCPRG